jgi:hypothetical protein
VSPAIVCGDDAPTYTTLLVPMTAFVAYVAPSAGRSALEPDASCRTTTCVKSASVGFDQSSSTAPTSPSAARATTSPGDWLSIVTVPLVASCAETAFAATAPVILAEIVYVAPGGAGIAACDCGVMRT